MALMGVIELGRPSPHALSRRVVADAPLWNELDAVLAVIRAVDQEGALTLLRDIRRVLDRLGESEAADRAVLEQILPRDIPPPSRLLQVRRNAQARTNLAAEFGLFSSAELAELRGAATGNPSSEPGRWLREQRVFSVNAPDRRFPGFQFDNTGRPRPVVAEVLAVLGELLQGWELALWFVGPNPNLEGRRPVDLIDADPDGVVDAARFHLDRSHSW